MSNFYFCPNKNLTYLFYDIHCMEKPATPLHTIIFLLPGLIAFQFSRSSPRHVADNSFWIDKFKLFSTSEC